jgi:hypothetical protein
MDICGGRHGTWILWASVCAMCFVLTNGFLLTRSHSQTNAIHPSSALKIRQYQEALQWRGRSHHPARFLTTLHSGGSNSSSDEETIEDSKNNNNNHLDEEDDEDDEPLSTLVADFRGRPAGVVIEDLNWRVERLKLEEANTRRFLKSGPRFLPYEECRKWVQAWGNRWSSAQEWCVLSLYIALLQCRRITANCNSVFGDVCNLFILL